MFLGGIAEFSNGEPVVSYGWQLIDEIAIGDCDDFAVTCLYSLKVVGGL